MKPLRKIEIKWSPKFAYAVGLLATDGCLYRDGRHFDLTSKDLEQIENFKKCLNLSSKIGLKGSGSTKEKRYFHIQFGDVVFFTYLLSIGLTPAKSRTIGKLAVPQRYFFDFLRGVFDGDGTSYSYWDPRWHSSYMFYTAFASGSLKFLNWLRRETRKQIGISGHITSMGTSGGNNNCYQLKYAKNDSLKLARKMYYNNRVICLKRKRLKLFTAIEINESAGGETGRLASLRWMCS